MNDMSMNHSELTRVYHELIGHKADLLNNNVARLLDFVRDRGNPYIIEAPGIKLHNVITWQTKKLSSTIPKRKLPQMDYKPPTETTVAPVTVSPTMIAAAQRDIEIVKERGMALDSIYNILSISTVFEGDLPSKPNKSALIADLEKYLADADMHFPGGDFSIILDFMSKIRSFTNLSSFGTFGHAKTCVLSAGCSICFRTSLHVVFDSYL